MTFQKLLGEIGKLSTLEGVDTFIIGHSVCGCEICAYHVGQYNDNQIIVTGAIHAREWITALLVCELVKMCQGDVLNDTLCHLIRPLDTSGIWFVPLCNPDGVKIALECQPLWKANARGVDLNVNFDADWGGGAQNIRNPGAENFIGPYPNSEPEVQALIDFTLRVKPKATVAYHSKGELVYFVNSRDACLAQKVADITGYIPEKTENSTGGYSDWVSMHLGIPALTIEVGNDDYSHPITEDKLREILEQNKDVPGIVLTT